MFQPLQNESLLEHCRANFLINIRKEPCRLTDSQSGGDDCARAGTTDVIEIVAESKVFPLPALLTEQVFHFDQDLKRHDTANSAAVEGEQFSWPLRVVSIFQVAPKRHRSSVKV